MNTEDKFYFGKPGQPERFAISSSDLNYAKSQIRAATPQRLREIEQELLPLAKSGDKNAKILLDYLKSEWNERYRGTYSRPGQPERFGLEDACWEGYEPVGTKQKDGRTVPNCVPKDENAEPEKFAASDVAAAINRFIIDIPKGATRDALQRALLDYADNTAAERRMKQQGNKTDALRFNHEVGRANEVAVSSWLRLGRDMKDLRGMLQQLDRAAFARPGQPDKFDASSLNRGDFAEASTSPMLGKLLAAKVMPEGGWRAVQVGSDTLVISFEDADLASDFGRRVATKGYNATSPVQAIGRYWNVEVKNGK